MLNARQAKLAKILSSSEEKFVQEDFYDAASPKSKRQIEGLLLEPIQGAIKKASKQFIATADICLEEAMTVMIRDQLNQDAWVQHLAPEEDILFEGDGIAYILKCLSLSDSRFL